MSLVLVHDSTNSKVKALECDANGLLKVDKVDVSALTLVIVDSYSMVYQLETLN